jgi:hypothetical protein
MSVVDWHKDKYDVYIGRHVPDGPQDLPPEACIYGNPFVLNNVNDPEERAQVIAKYEKWLLSSDQDWLVAKARKELKGQVLGCWCKPKDCHGDVLMWVARCSKEQIEERRRALGLD